MAITNALASLAVRDLATASQWYEKLLGPGSHPMDEVWEWKFEGGGGVQVYRAPERAGYSTCTLITSDIDDAAEHLRRTGIAPDAQPVRGEHVDTVMIKDPDGNSIAFSQPKDALLTR